MTLKMVSLFIKQPEDLLDERMFQTWNEHYYYSFHIFFKFKFLHFGGILNNLLEQRNSCFEQLLVHLVILFVFVVSKHTSIQWFSKVMRLSHNLEDYVFQRQLFLLPQAGCDCKIWMKVEVKASVMLQRQLFLLKEVVITRYG